MALFIPANNQWADAAQSLGGAATGAYIHHHDEAALRNSIEKLGPNASAREILDTITKTKTYSPKAKQNALKNYMGVKEFEEAQRKAQAAEAIGQEKNRIAELKAGTTENKESQKQNYLLAGYPEYEADLMTDPNVTPATKQQIAKQHADLAARGIRQPLVPQENKIQPTQDIGEKPSEGIQNTEQPMEEPPGQDITQFQPTEDVQEPEWPEIPPPAQTTLKEQESWKQKNQTFNNKELKELRGKNTAHKNAMVRYGIMTNLNESKKLPSGVGRLIIDPATGDVRPTASLVGAVNKETQAFAKTVNDFLIDAKNYFGGRVTNFDVGAFKARLPGLLNTEEGRRMIIEEMKLMEELQLLHDGKLEDGLKHYGRNANYSDILNITDKKVEGKEKELIYKINNLDQASDYLDVMAKDPKYKDTKLMQNPETGKFKAFRPGEIQVAKDRGWIQW